MASPRCASCMPVLTAMLCAAFSVGLAEGATSLMMKAASRSVTRGRTSLLSGYRYSMQDPAARTLLTLDKNKDGRIDPEEVALFATTQGLDAESAKQEFSGIDVNGDGVLDSKELTAVLGSDPAPATPPQPGVNTAEAAKPAEIQPELAARLPAVQPAAKTQAADLASNVDLVDLPDMSASQASLPTFTSSAQDFSSVGTHYNHDAQTAASDVVKELSYEEQEEAAARGLERKAAELHANSATLARVTAQNALLAGEKAARTKANALISSMSTLEKEAERAEVRAAALHAKSKAEMKEANSLMAITGQALS